MLFRLAAIVQGKTEKAEIIKLLMAAVVGGLLKELVTWLIGFTKVSLFGPMWKHSRGVLTHLFTCGFYGLLLIRFGMTDGAATKLDVLLMMGCGLGFFGVCHFPANQRRKMEGCTRGSDNCRTYPKSTIGRKNMSDFSSIDTIPEIHMSKSLEELLLGAENQAAASKAVRCAVARAAAAGLPPAYQTTSQTMACLEKDTEKRRVRPIAGREPAT